MVIKLRKRFSLDSKSKFVIAVLSVAFAHYIVFFLYPVLDTFVLSFTKWDILSPREFKGLENYYNMVDDPNFSIAFKNTFFYSFTVVIIGACLSLFVAIMLNSIKRFVTIFRTIYFLPVVTSVVAITIVWGYFFHPGFGLLNSIIGIFGIPSQMWLSDPALAMPSVLLLNLWKGLGYTIVIFLAGLQGIPMAFYEAAEMDGANRRQIFWRITLPLLQPTIIFVLVTRVIQSLQIFSSIYVLLGEGLGTRSLLVVVLYIYLNAFQFLSMGYAAAIACALFAIIMAFTIFQLSIFRVKWEY